MIATAVTIIVPAPMRVIAVAVVVMGTTGVGSRGRRAIIGTMAMVIVSPSPVMMIFPIFVIAILRVAFLITIIVPLIFAPGALRR